MIADRIELDNVSLLKLLAQHPHRDPGTSAILAVIILSVLLHSNHTDPLAALGEGRRRPGHLGVVWGGKFQEVRLGLTICSDSFAFFFAARERIIS